MVLITLIIFIFTIISTKKQFSKSKTIAILKLFYSILFLNDDSRNDSKRIPKWVRNECEIIPKRFQNESEMSVKLYQNDSKMSAKLCQNNSKMIPKKFKAILQILTEKCHSENAQGINTITNERTSLGRKNIGGGKKQQILLLNNVTCLLVCL